MRRSTLELVAAAGLAGSMVAVAAGVAWYGRVGVPGRDEPGTTVVELTGVGASGVWTLEAVHGLNYWWKSFQPATIHLRQGDEVVLNLRSADLFHCFYAPGLGLGPVDVEPGHQRTLRFRADRPGVHQYYCTSMCGTCHFYMRGWIVVTPPGEEPIDPPPILCQFCLPEDDRNEPMEVPTTGPALAEHGSSLYLRKGCVTCHGPEGRGGVPNPNSTLGEPPAHDATARKLFLASEDDARAFVELLASEPDLEAVEDAPDVARFGIVRTRYLDAEEIVRTGRYTAKAKADGPEPPLQMPAWEVLVDEREIDALMAWFVSLQDWEDDA